MRYFPHNNDLVSRYIEKLLVMMRKFLIIMTSFLVIMRISRNNEKLSHNNDLISRNEKLSRYDFSRNDLLKKIKNKKNNFTHAQCKSDGTLATSAGQSHAGTPQTLLVLSSKTV